MPERTIMDIVSGFAITVVAAITGHNHLQISRLREKTPEDYRSKDDCKDLCSNFNLSMNKLHDSMEAGFTRILDKIEKKADKP